ncbi:MAG: alkaline phosphatase [Gemmatimonadota bacterium]
MAPASVAARLVALAAGTVTFAVAACGPAARQSIRSGLPDAPAALRAEAAAAIRFAPESLGVSAGPATEPRVLLGPMIGYTTDTSARLWLQLDRGGRLNATLRGPDGEEESGWAIVHPDEGNVAVVEVHGLEASTEYTASLTLDDQPLEVRPVVRFRTFPPDGVRGRYRIALVSCPRVVWDSLQTIWSVIPRDRPDVLVWLGDNNYFEHGDSAAGIPPDYTSLRRMAFRHAQLRALPSLQTVLRTIPNVAIWDDHDYGPSNSGREYAMREGSAVLFTRYWANASYGGPGLDGIWSQFRIGDVDVFLTDNRYWRDSNETPDSPTKTMLGAAQKAWLKERLAASQARVKVVAVGSQVLADYHEWESYANYAYERDELLDWIRDERIDGVVFVSGDRHLSELQKAEPEGIYPLWELTASPAANRPFVTGLEIPNPIRVDGYGAGFNYGTLDIDTRAGTITFRVVDVEGLEVFAHTARLDDLRFAPAASRR